jgi:hypothetical protein
MVLLSSSCATNEPDGGAAPIRLRAPGKEAKILARVAEADASSVVIQLTPPGTTPVSDRPTLTLYARAGKREVALGRWPTTIGGWKTIEK